MTQDAAPSRRIAVLDDDIRFIRMVERALRSAEYEIQPVTTPDLLEAVDVIIATDCDVALVDVLMYGRATGFEVIERLRSEPRTRELPLVVTSGARRELARRLPFLQEHRCQLLIKPFTIDALIEQMRSIELRRSGASRRGDGAQRGDGAGGMRYLPPRDGKFSPTWLRR